MDILFTILTIGFVALLLTAAVTFGFTLLMVIVLMAGFMTLFSLVHALWRRWRFVQSASQWPEKPTIIEGDYKDISNHKEDV